jgi:hypothetical protein
MGNTHTKELKKLYETIYKVYDIIYQDSCKLNQALLVEINEDEAIKKFFEKSKGNFEFYFFTNIN